MRESNTMQGKSLLERDELFRIGDTEKIWQKYCGFLDLSLEEFMAIQERLLMEQIDLAWNSKLGRKIMGNQKPKSVEEFRRIVPLTTYEDYEPYLSEKREDVLAEKPVFWARTSGRGGSLKWVPYTLRAEEEACKNMIGAWILASAERSHEVNLRLGGRMLFNLPQRPYFSGWLAYSLMKRINFLTILPMDLSERMEFQERIAESFKIALRTGVDYLASLSSILVKLGEDFRDYTSEIKLSWSMLHPLVFFRLIRASLRCKLIEKRDLLPKDLWPVRAIFAWGADTSIYREQILHHWGRIPYEIYGATEAGIIAMQNWNKEWMSFIPYNNFLEFVPEEERLQGQRDRAHQPATLLLNELKEGQTYEIIITNFHGMPFLRYRLGDLLRVVALRDKKTGTNLPQVLFQSRADDIVDLAGFTRLDEKTIWQAIANTGLMYEDWTTRKEYEQNSPVLHLYIELKESREAKEVERAVHEQLKVLDPDYRDLTQMLAAQPLKVTLLSKGTFQSYLEQKRKAGADLAHLKPRHTNAPYEDVEELIRLSSRG